MIARLDGLRRADAKEDPVKHCNWCGTQFFRRRINGRLEDFTGFSHRQFCSQSCASTDRGRARSVPLEQRLQAGLRKDLQTGCWKWAFSTDEKGYGQINHRGSILRTHRLAWELTHGAIPKGMLVCHRCDTPRCCNPDHLFLGTHADNTRDMVEKGRHVGGANQPNKRSAVR